MIRTVLQIALALWLSLICAQATFAQTESQPVNVDDIEALVATLEDEGRRDELVAQLKALIAAQDAVADEPTPVESVGAEVVAALSGGIARVGEQIGEAVDTLSEAPATIRALIEQASDRDTLVRWFTMFSKLVLVLILGLAARAFARRLLKRSRERLADRDDEGLFAAIILFAVRAVLIIVPVAVFGVVTWLVLLASQPEPVTRLIGLSLINAAMVIQGVLVIARLVVVPAHGRSLVGASDETAAYVLIWLKRLMAIAIFGYFFAEAALLLGLSAGAHAVLLKVIGLVIALLLIILTLQNRRRVADALRDAANGDYSSLASRLAELWHLPALLYVFIAYGTWALQRGDGFAFLAQSTISTAVLAVIAVLVLKGLALLLGRGLSLSDELRKSYPGLENRSNRYFGVVRRIVRIVVLIAAALILIEIWIGGSIDWLTGETGRALVGRIVTIALVIAGAVMLSELVTSVIERMLANADRGGDSARIRTLLPLIRKVLFAVLTVMVSLMVLSELGIDIGPLLAGAGVIGLAVGFGAQTLVKDVITGLFILVENTIAVGDWVDVGGHEGEVESLSIRTVSLRDSAGNVHTVPFSVVGTVLNYTRDYSNVVLNIGIGYQENVDEVMQVIVDLGREMAEDPTLAPNIITPLVVQGVQSLDDSAVVIRARFRVRAGTQWGLKREFNRRMKNRFDELGIEIPFPHRTVYFGKEKDRERDDPPPRAFVGAPARPSSDAGDAGDADGD